MVEPPSLMTLQFLAWVSDRPRTRADAMEAWRSCPHYSVWEDSLIAGLVRTSGKSVVLTARGRAMLVDRTASQARPSEAPTAHPVAELGPRVDRAVRRNGNKLGSAPGN